VPNFNALARIAVLLALLSFLLPWVALSIFGNEIVRGSGVQLMTGNLELTSAASNLLSQTGGGDKAAEFLRRAGPDYVLVAAGAVIALGLAASFALKWRAASMAIAVAAILGVVLCFCAYAYIDQLLSQQLQHIGHKSHHGLRRILETQVRDTIHVDKLMGFWVATVALAVAAVLASLAIYRSQQIGATPSDEPSA
jgi:hypothetical protein